MSAQVRSIAARNEVLGLPPVVGEAPVFVTKDDAREAQRAESQIYGGQIPRRGMAASMQVSEFGDAVFVQLHINLAVNRVQRIRLSMRAVGSCRENPSVYIVQ